MDASTMTHLYAITDGIGAVATGTPSDALALISRARTEAANYKYKFGVSISVGMLARRMAMLAQVPTQKAGVRPLGVALILAGFDEDGFEAEELGGGFQNGQQPNEVSKPRIYKIDPSGHYAGYFATSAGPKSADLMNAFERVLAKAQQPADNDNDDVPVASSTSADSAFGANREETIDLALATLSSTLGLELKPSDVEVGIVELPTRQAIAGLDSRAKFTILHEDEIELSLSRVAERE